MAILDLLHELEDAAKMEDWKRVDEKLIPDIKDKQSFYAVQRAVYKLQDVNPHVRDAFATVIQNGYDFSSDKWAWVYVRNTEAVAAHMVKRLEPNQVVRYRLAIAFAKNGVGRYGDLVKKNLEEAVSDKYVGEEARHWLHELYGES